MQDQSFKTQIDYNKVLFWILLLYLVWQVKRGWDKSKQQVISENAGSDLSTQQAIQLRQAMNPSGSGWLMSFDGTSSANLMATARAITNYQNVSQAYRALYGEDLTSDLTGELSQEELTQFWAIINAAKPTSGGTPTGGTTTPKPTTGTTTPTVKPKQVIAKQTVNVRAYAKPTVVDHQAAKGQIIGNYVGEAYLTVTGSRQLFVHVQYPVYMWVTGILMYNVDYYVHKGSVTIQ